ncbi:MAG: DUF3276 family protein [Prevotella sp.]|nr:DUF3276 family protein [Prevotella sp.]
MENVKAFKEREIASYSIRTVAGRVFFDLKYGNRENYLQITQSKKIGDNEFHREKIILSKSELSAFKNGITKAMGFLEAIREEVSTQNSNGYRPWEDAEEEKLLLLYQEGKSMKEIGDILGRSRGAIKSRFEKIMQNRGGELPMTSEEFVQLI